MDDTFMDEITDSMSSEFEGEVMTRKEKLELAIEMLERLAMFSDEDCTVNISDDKNMQDVEASQREGVALRFAVTILKRELDKVGKKKTLPKWHKP